MADISLTKKQLNWLDSRGGRDITDVEVDEKGLYVLMLNGHEKEVKVYLPA